MGIDAEPQQQFNLFIQHLKQSLNSWSELRLKSNIELTVKETDSLPTVLPVIALSEQSPLLVLLPTESELQQLARDLRVLGQEHAIFESWGSSPLRGIASRQLTFANRSALLGQLLNRQVPVLLACFESLAPVLPSPKQLNDQIISLQQGQDYQLEALERRFTMMGYLRVPRVTIAGEYALRGEIIDIFPPGDQQPLRLRFSFEQLEEIVRFDFVNQRSIAKKQQYLRLYPTKEFCWTKERITALEERILELQITINDSQQRQLERLHEGLELCGEEFLFALASRAPSSLFDYLTSDTTLLLVGKQRLVQQAKTRQREYHNFASSAAGQQSLLPPVAQFYLEPEKIRALAKKHLTRLVFLDELKGVLLPVTTPPRCQGNIIEIRERLAELSDEGYSVHIGAASEGQAQRLRYLFRNSPYPVHAALLNKGFLLPEAKLLMLQEHEILGHQISEVQQGVQANTAGIDSFLDLEPGDYVVHLSHGIGRFRGIERLQSSRMERDYIAIEFADEVDIFVPIEQLDLLQRYVGSSGSKPKLDQVGGGSWQKRKEKTRREVADLADQLLRLYARRSDAKGFPFPDAEEMQVEFEADFPYQETLDQLQATQEILSDMSQAKPMDRLLCGDVGFGKTEVAMRACFKAVQAGKQVAFLCPTTILAEQHNETFHKRFQRFPVNIACMSRLIPLAEQKRNLAGAAEGRIDILIGTHRLLSNDVRFKDLGLLVIDEEQRFGVKNKEKLKQLKTSIDCLSLSATPIPRTLHMSLLEIRDMSLLTTAPSSRHPIETTVQRFDATLVATAIRNELDRGGQVFYLHNKVESLTTMRDFLRQLVPEAIIAMAHGQMPVKQLEDVMHGFINCSSQVLVATTIIENGIDIPNVNTIIISRADQYGISQLYQLRGRVGRSDRIAYAYLLYPENRVLSELAVKRLRIISDFTELGSGFKVAIRDLEVRGAGHLLGAKQSGQIAAVGFDLYLKLLNQAIRERKQYGEQLQAPILELEYSGFIPDSYVPDAYEKMEIYQRIGAVSSSKELVAFYEELNDRFGTICDEVASLMSLAELRVLCFNRQIASVRENRGRIAICFRPQAPINIDKVLALMNRQPGKVQLQADKPNTLIYNLDTGVGLLEKSEHLRDLLGQL